MTWFRCSSGQSANLGTKSISANGTYNASSDDLDGYSAVTVNVPSLPSYMVINEQTLSEAAESLVVPYDSTRDIDAIICYDTANDVSAKAATCQMIRKNYTSEGSWMKTFGYTSGSNPPSDTGTSSYGSVTFDDQNNTITFTLRDSSYKFRADRTYRTIIIYAET